MWQCLYYLLHKFTILWVLPLECRQQTTMNVFQTKFLKISDISSYFSWFTWEEDSTWKDVDSYGCLPLTTLGSPELKIILCGIKFTGSHSMESQFWREWLISMCHFSFFFLSGGGHNFQVHVRIKCLIRTIESSNVESFLCILIMQFLLQMSN